jgi:hypothetical protein
VKLGRTAAAAMFLAAACHAQERCAVAKDLQVRALELVSAQPSQEDLGNGLLLLKQAQQACDEDGDAWYYRSLFERQLAHARLADYALGKARERGSHAQKDGDDPFHLVTNQSRLLRDPGWTRLSGSALRSLRHCSDALRSPVAAPSSRGSLPAAAPHFLRRRGNELPHGPLHHHRIREIDQVHGHRILSAATPSHPTRRDRSRSPGAARWPPNPPRCAAACHGPPPAPPRTCGRCPREIHHPAAPRLAHMQLRDIGLGHARKHLLHGQIRVRGNQRQRGDIGYRPRRACVRATRR